MTKLGSRLLTRSLADRFWEKVNMLGAEADECWEWGARRDANGYGTLAVRRGSNPERAHRIAWMLANAEPIPKGFYICHRCDNPPCCNPAHLFLGTPTDNVRDAMSKGRMPPPAGPRVRKPSPPCGTNAMYQRHMQQGQDCTQCRRAHADYVKSRYKPRGLAS